MLAASPEPFAYYTVCRGGKCVLLFEGFCGFCGGGGSLQRLAVPPAAQQRTSDLAGDIVTLAAMEGVACPVLALAAALVLQSMAYGILVGLEEPAEAVM